MKNYVTIDMRKRVLDKSAEFQPGSYGFRINVVLGTEEGILQNDPGRLWEYAIMNSILKNVNWYINKQQFLWLINIQPQLQPGNVIKIFPEFVLQLSKF